MKDLQYEATIAANEALSEVMTRHSVNGLESLKTNLETIYGLFNDSYGHNHLEETYPELSHTIDQIIEDIEFSIEDIKTGESNV
tara:strand:+ start:73 stop:324 length:252 start_codon:yes stop_codon:yes gene_type:complete